MSTALLFHLKYLNTSVNIYLKVKFLYLWLKFYNLTINYKENFEEKTIILESLVMMASWILSY